MERYNGLLKAVRASCVELQRGIRGLVVMSADLDAVFDALVAAKVSGCSMVSWLASLRCGPDRQGRWLAGESDGMNSSSYAVRGLGGCRC
jgi:hypothetical protein